MASAASNYFRRLTKRLTEDIDELDAAEMATAIESAGARRAIECVHGEEITMLGRLRSVETGTKAGGGAMEAELWDGTAAVTLVWLGRRRIPGIETGKTILVRGRLGERDGKKVLYSPYYELQGDG